MSAMPEWRGRFLLLERIHAYGDAFIRGRSQAADGWTVLEACAQLCAFHVRLRHDFSRHAFLLAFGDFSLPQGAGCWDIHAELQAASSRTCIYRAAALCGNQRCGGELHIGMLPYDAHFQESILRPHYEGIFQCLHS